MTSFTRHARGARAFLIVASALALAACGKADPTSPPTGPQRWDVRLTTPNAREGGVLVALAGAPVDSVQAPAGTTAIVVARDGAGAQARTHVVLRGDVRSGVVATAWTTRGTGNLSVTLAQAVAPTTFVQRTLGGYTTTVQRR